MTSSAAPAVQCEHNSLIRRQFMRIESLESEMAILRQERDVLQGENERLHFQLQCIDQIQRTEAAEDRNYRSCDVRDNGCPLLSSSLDPTLGQHLSSSSSSISRQSVVTSVQTSNDCNNYEISQQLIDRRVDALERKYGGLIARQSATRIQRAFRTYRLQKRFKSIAIQALRQTTTVRDNNDDHHVVQRQSLSDTQSTLSSDDNHNNNNVFIADSLLSSSSPSSSSSTCAQECDRKRKYRVGLNLFNKHPSERGIQYLLTNGFIELIPNSPESQSQLIARFLLTRKGLSKAMIGQYVSTKTAFNQLVLKAFAREIDLCGLEVDSALRKFQTFFRFPGEAQMIERLVDAFATRYMECNPHEKRLSRDSVFILSFAIIMLNTDLHSATNARHRMTSNQWIHNLNQCFNNEDSLVAHAPLNQIYARIKGQELRTGADHVTQVAKVQGAIVAANSRTVVPNLCAEWRRLVCYCRLYELRDPLKKESKDRHQREVFLFNDLLLVTKLSSRARNSHQIPEYVYRQSVPLDGMTVQLFHNQFHRFGLHVRSLEDRKLVLSFNARNELDQKRFADDLRESILETQAMEHMRNTTSHFHKSNSLLQLAATGGPDASSSATSSTTASSVQNRRKSSSGSLDSGLSLPSRDHSPQTAVSTAPEVTEK